MTIYQILWTIYAISAIITAFWIPLYKIDGETAKEIVDKKYGDKTSNKVYFFAVTLPIINTAFAVRFIISLLND